jgi:hypothetical protein
MNISPEWTAHLAGAAQSLIVLGVGYLVRTAFSLNKRTERLERILTGEDGTNGLRSTVNAIKATVDDHQLKHARLSTELGVIKDDLDRVERMRAGATIS